MAFSEYATNDYKYDNINEERMEGITVVIKKDANGEYRAPGPNGTEAQAYYTDDKQDAVATCIADHKRAGIIVAGVKCRTIQGYHNE